jgi:type II secretory pathway predicted ATPase ExeA
MYEKEFGLRRRPFRATPDTDSYYPATTHERALARLLQGIADDEGLLLLTGAPGTGKTLLCQRLLEQLGADVSSAFLTNSHFNSRAGLLQAILYDLSLPYAGLSEQELRLALTDHLLQNYSAGRRAIVVLDEAQHMTPDLLEELRLLSNLEAREGKALQVILVAQPGFSATLRAPDLAGFSQRLAVRAELEPFGIHEAADYLLHHLRAAGGRPDHFMSDEAVEILARGSGGVPRVLNQVGHQALLLAHSAGVAQIDAEVAVEALAMLGLNAGVAAESDDLPAEAPCAEAGDAAGPVLQVHAEEKELSLVGGEKKELSPERRPTDENSDVAHLFTSPRRPA